MKPERRNKPGPASATKTTDTVTCHHCRYEKPKGESPCPHCGFPWPWLDKAGRGAKS